jgi:hypothetical protein
MYYINKDYQLYDGEKLQKCLGYWTPREFYRSYSYVTNMCDACGTSRQDQLQLKEMP